ncbi:MAG: LD-carboxypeptidase [Bacteroidota bacterium]|nr:LD-carboxypeptidase [Bacteroidota bacterium]
MNRKKFLTTASAAALLAAMPYKSMSAEDRKKRIKTIKPPRLRAGDTLGLISPGSFISEKELEESKDNLTKLGFKVVTAKNVLARHGYLGGTDIQRADDVNEMFANMDVKGIVCTRGGYGCARILSLLDYDLIKHNPKVLIGYSDITSLLYGLYSQTGLVCFHGPVGTSTFNDFSVKNFTDVLINPVKPLTLTNALPEKDTEYFKPKIIKGGMAEGILTGGNLSIVVSLVGTPYDIDTDGKILFLEEVGEEPYRVDRMLTQMKQAGKFNKVKGIVLGVFTRADSKPESFSDSLSLFDVLSDRLCNLGVPVVYGMSFGHIVNKFTLPICVHCSLNADEKTITLKENAVL